MAKKGSKKTEQVAAVEEVKEAVVQTVFKEEPAVDKVVVDEKLCRRIESESLVGIEDLIAYERACALVCARYEVKARLSGEDNEKFRRFSDYHQEIMNELERRVAQAVELNRNR